MKRNISNDMLYIISFYILSVGCYTERKSDYLEARATQVSLPSPAPDPVTNIIDC